MKDLPRALRYLRPRANLAVVSAAVTVLLALVGLLVPWPLKLLADNVLGGYALTPLLADMLGPLAQSRYTLLGVVLVAGLAITLVGDGLNVLGNYVNTKLEQEIALNFRGDLFEHAQRLSLAFHEQSRAGMLIYAINFQAQGGAALVMAIQPLAQSLLTLLGMFWISLYIDRQLTLLALVVIPFLYYSVRYYATHIQERLLQVKNMEAESLAIVHEAMSMLRVIVAFGREGHEHRRFRDQATRAVDARVRLTVRQTLFSLAVNTTTAVGTALVLGLGAHQALQGKVTLGQLLVVMAYVAAVYQPLVAISTTVGALQDQLVSLRMAFQLLDTEPEIKDAPGAMNIERAKGQITFEGVHFTHKRRVNTLTDISFDVEAGRVIAMVGPTGAGKTTLVSLIPRFYDVDQGRILLDGRDIRTLTLKSLRRQISIVLQEPLLFSGTIGDNIRYGRPEASLAEIIEAAKAANAHDFIMALPNGYDTELGERGAQLSGGERQRIAVARAFLKDAPILILDEPTSSIDSKTEAVILDALDRLMVGRTTFTIAHRLSTIRNADRILVLDHGRIVEQGTQAELLQRDGLFKQLYDAQTGPSRRGSSPTMRQDVAGTAKRVHGRRHRPRIALLGMMAQMPAAGVIWQTVHYLIGFQRLGYDVYYVEAHAMTPSKLMRRKDDDSSMRAAAYIDRVMRHFDLRDRWAFHALHDTGRCYGLSKSELKPLYRSAALLINLHGGTTPLPEHSETGRLIYVETDPVALQIELYEKRRETIEFLEPHQAFFTFGENYGNPDCELPVSERFKFRPTRQPVVIDFWYPYRASGGEAFTTIGNWRQWGRDVSFRGEVYHWSKHHEFLKFVDLPSRTTQPFELALGRCDESDGRLLESKGWRIRDALEFTEDIDAYRRYIGCSRGEFTVAKDQNIRLRSGWFSDRSATYLAAGKPVITQETGFSNILPTGLGLFGFSTLEEILHAVQQINSAYEDHSRAAYTLARAYFDSDVVLKRLLSDVGL